MIKKRKKTTQKKIPKKFPSSERVHYIKNKVSTKLSKSHDLEVKQGFFHNAQGA